MYVPKVFAVEDLAQLQDFMEEFNFATMVTERDGELTASHIPFLLDRSVEPYGALRAHIAIRNPQLKDCNPERSSAGDFSRSALLRFSVVVRAAGERAHLELHSGARLWRS